MFRTPTFRFLLGFGLCSLGGAMLYIYFKNRDEDDIIDGIDGIPNSSNKKEEKIKIQLVVSNEIVPILIGRSGANLKIIEDKTGTVIRFREKDDNHHYCEINGLKNSVMNAKEMLMKEIQKSPVVKEEIFVPQSACGKIIGRCGEALQEICRKSLAKVSVDSGDRSQGSTTRRVVITGNRSQVNIAKKLIEQKVKEDEEFRKSVEQVEQKREPRRSPTSSVSSNHSSMTSSLNSCLPLGEKLMNSDSEKALEVYVSAIASPGKFWLQLVGPQSSKLDELVENMTEYYNQKENQDLHKITDPYLGQIVAALFKYDGKWYRAEIVGILPNEYNPHDVVLDLYFVDYGDSEYVAPNEVFELRTDFLTLRFQAIECFLAHVKPALPTERHMWEQQAITKFEELTHVASWKKLVSRVVTYKDRPKGKNHGRREGSPIPGVELFDTSGEIEINIAHALISEGFAASDYQNNGINNVLRLDGGYFNRQNDMLNYHQINEIQPSSSRDENNLTENNEINNTHEKLTLNENSNNINKTTKNDLDKLNQFKTFQNGHNYNMNDNKTLSERQNNSFPNDDATKLEQNLKIQAEKFLQNEKTINYNIEMSKC